MDWEDCELVLRVCRVGRVAGVGLVEGVLGGLVGLGLAGRWWLLVGVGWVGVGVDWGVALQLGIWLVVILAW